jgi:hypothetical protein
VDPSAALVCLWAFDSHPKEFHKAAADAVDDGLDNAAVHRTPVLSAIAMAVVVADGPALTMYDTESYVLFLRLSSGIHLNS